MVLFAGLFLIGLIIGLYDSVVGSGGLAMVSVLSLLGVSPVFTIGTARVLTLVQETVSLAAFLKKRLVEVKLSFVLGLISAVGAIIGANLVFSISEDTLSVIIVVLMVILAIIIPFLNIKKQIYRPLYMLKDLYESLTDQDTTAKSVSKKRLVVLGIAFVALGVYGGFYGPGFGTLSLILFTYIGGTNFLTGAGNARMVGFIMSLAAGVIFLTRGAVSWQHFVPLSLGTIIGAWYGVEFADKLGAKYVKALLTIAVALISIKLLLNIM